MIEIGKKYKKIAKGDLKLLTKYFLEGKNIYENWIILKPFTRQLENLGVNSDLLKSDKGNGKIYATIELKDAQDDFKKKVEKYGPKEGEIYTDEMPKKNEFNDNLSDVSISIVDTKEEDRDGLELEQFIEYEYIEGLKLLLQHDYKNILPNDFVKLRQLNEILYGKYIDLSNAYNETLYSLSSINEEIRQQAKKYYEEYKLLKKDVYNGRIELKKQNEELQLEIKDNNQENLGIKEDIEKYINDKQKFKKLLGIDDSNKKEKNENEDNDNILLINMLKNLSEKGYDIFKGADLSEEELKLIEGCLDIQNKPNINSSNNINSENKLDENKEIKNIENKEIKDEMAKNSDNKENIDINYNNINKEVINNGSENKNNYTEKKNENDNDNGGYDYENDNDNDNDIKEDFELGNQIVSLIEKDVNDLYLKKIIEQVKIDQINAITYKFEREDEDNPHEITLKIENDELFCIDGTKFSAWLIKHFST